MKANPVKHMLAPAVASGPGLASGQQGISIMEVIIALALVTISALALMQATSNTTFFREAVSTGSAYRDVEMNFRSALARALQKNLSPTQSGNVCAGGSLSVQENLGNGLAIGLTQKPPTLPTGAPAATVAAAQRCNNGAFRSLPGSNDIYMCVQFAGTGGNGYSSSSMAGSPLVFAEVRARVLNVATGAGLNCAAFAQAVAGATAAVQQGQAVLDITYSLYWYSRSKPINFKHHNGSFYASITGG